MINSEFAGRTGMLAGAGTMQGTIVGNVKSALKPLSAIELISAILAR
jgi:hypothetical protein